MLFDSDFPTGLAFISTKSDGERDYAFFRNSCADMLLSADELVVPLVSGCKILHFGTISLIQEPSRTTTLAAIKIARDNGAIISCDVNLRAELWEDPETARLWMRKALELSDVAKLSADEVIFLREREGLEGLQEWYDDPSRPRLSTVTCGHRGCFFASGDSCFAAHPGYWVDAVDTTGAGDGFTAGFLHGLLEHAARPEDLDSLDEADLTSLCAYANAVGALACTRKGAIPAMPTAGEVSSFLESRRLRV
jgi:fructokinase